MHLISEELRDAADLKERANKRNETVRGERGTVGNETCEKEFRRAVNVKTQKEIDTWWEREVGERERLAGRADACEGRGYANSKNKNSRTREGAFGKTQER